MCRYGNPESPQKCDEGRAEEHDEQRGQDAEGEREEHEERQAARGGFGTMTLGCAERIGLYDEEMRERRAEPRRCGDERRDPRFVGPARESAQRSLETLTE